MIYDATISHSVTLYFDAIRSQNITETVGVCNKVAILGRIWCCKKRLSYPTLESAILVYSLPRNCHR